MISRHSGEFGMAFKEGIDEEFERRLRGLGSVG